MTFPNSARLVSVIAGAMLVTPLSVLAQQKPGYGPVDGLVNLQGFEPLLFSPGGDLLALTGRPGLYTLRAQTQRWERAMNGVVGLDGVEPPVDYACQAPSAPNTVYAFTGPGYPSVFQGLFRS